MSRNIVQLSQKIKPIIKDILGRLEKYWDANEKGKAQESILKAPTKSTAPQLNPKPDQKKGNVMPLSSRIAMKFLSQVDVEGINDATEEDLILR